MLRSMLQAWVVAGAMTGGVLVSGSLAKAVSASAGADDTSFGRGEAIGRVFPAVTNSDRVEASPYTFCFENTITSIGSGPDRDASNGVTQIHSVSTSEASAAESAISEPLLIPLPPAAWTGLAGLLGLGAFRAVGAMRRSARRTGW